VTVEAIRRSPLGDNDFTALAPALLVVERPFLTHLTVRGADAGLGAALGVELPSAACTFTSGASPFGPVQVAWMGPDELLVLAPADVQVELEALVRQYAGAVVDVSAQRTTVELSGPHVRDVLAHGCSIDLHPTSARTGTCVQTLLARTGIVLLVRDAGRGEFTVLVRSSFAAYFAAWLTDAALEYQLPQLAVELR
jgi:sarcosine oxidase subunit gamma